MGKFYIRCLSTGFSDFPKIREIGIPENPDFRVFRNFRNPISESPDFRESENPDFQVSGLPNPRKSGFPDFWCQSGLEASCEKDLADVMAVC